MSTEITLTESRPEVLTKMQAWAVMGKTIHDSNLQFQARAQSIVTPLKEIPTKENVLESEIALKSVKKEAELLGEDILKITRKFDSVCDQLRLSKKLIETEVSVFSSALLSVKQEIKKDEDTARAKKDELSRIREALTKRISEVDASFRTMIALRITDVYERGLNGECPTDDTRVYLENEKLWATEEMFITKQPKVAPVHNTLESVDEIWKELSTQIQPPKFYIDLFITDITTKFEFYSIALKHKESSIAQAQKEQNEKLSEITKEKELAAQGARLAAVASTYEVQNIVQAKGLKQEWKVQMEDNEKSVFAIMHAFITNYDACKGGIRVKSLMNLSVEQMSNSLAWAKNKDEKFAVTGINFVLVDKL